MSDMEGSETDLSSLITDRRSASDDFEGGESGASAKGTD